MNKKVLARLMEAPPQAREMIHTSLQTPRQPLARPGPGPDTAARRNDNSRRALADSNEYPERLSPGYAAPDEPANPYRYWGINE
jgi:hypothetical protein